MRDSEMQDAVLRAAERLGQMAAALDRLSDPEVLAALLREVPAGERATLDGLLGGLPSIPRKCFWIREQIHAASCEPTLVEQCDLRDDLTWDERVQAMAIFIQHQKEWEANAGPGIAPGPLLDALKAAGFVSCHLVRTAVCHATIMLGPWDHVCIGGEL